MAHFALTKPGGWATLYVPVVGDYNDLDTKSFKSINGDDGGTWIPTSAIIVGGSGMQIPNGATWTVLSGGTMSVVGTISTNGGTISLDATGTLSVAGLVSLNTGALANWHTGTTCNWLTGSTQRHENGSTLQIDQGCSVILNGGISAGATGSITMTSAGAGALLINGNTISINDATNPTFFSTRSRSIFQPMVAQANGFSAVFGGYLNDNATAAGGNTTFLPLTKLINGARWNTVTIKYSVSSSHTPTTPASVTLLQMAADGTATNYVTVNAATGVSGLQTMTITVPPSLFVDDSTYTYFLKIVAEGGTGVQAISWYCPKVNFDTIAFVGQF